MFNEAPVVRNVLMALRKFLLGLNVTLKELRCRFMASEGRHKPYAHGLCARSSHCHDPSLAVGRDGKRSWVSDCGTSRADQTACRDAIRLLEPRAHRFERGWVGDHVQSLNNSTTWSALSIGIPAGRAVTSNAGILRIGFTPPPAGRAGEGAAVR